MAILDTDILIAFLKGAPDAIQKITALEEKGNHVSTTIITAYELLKGAYLSNKPEESLAKIDDVLSEMQIFDLTFKACEEAARIYKELKKKGFMVGEFDILIASIAVSNEEIIVTRDEHFETLVSSQKLVRW